MTSTHSTVHRSTDRRTADRGTADRPGAPAGLPTADEAVAHTLLNCLLREVSGPERRTAVVDGHLLVRLPRRGVLLRVALRRTSLIGAHRFSGAVTEQTDDGWSAIGWSRLAEHLHAELSLLTGAGNDEFLDQVASSHRGVAAALALPRPRPATGADGDPMTAYLASEQSLVLGHRFHPTPKARGGDPAAWSAYAPEAAASFPLRLLAVRDHLAVEGCAEPGALAPLDRLGPVPEGYRLLPAHPWQYALLHDHPALRAALGSGDVLDLGAGRTPFSATASVRTLYDGDTFLKFSLNVRITNCLRKNARYELEGAVALTRLLEPVFADLSRRFPGCGLLREPAYRSLALPGPDGGPVPGLLEGFGVIVREGLGRHLRRGVTPLLAAAVADEYPTGPAQVSRLLAGAGAEADAGAVLSWWRAYLELLVPPVLAAYFDHGVVLEPHLQNVLVGMDADGRPSQVLFRDLEGTKLLPGRHAAALSALPAEVAGPLTYDAGRGWDRVVYCLLVNHVAELLAALADLHPGTERALWSEVHRALRTYADAYGCPARLGALLSGGALPAKANLLTRWARTADRQAGYVRLPSPLAPDAPAKAARRETLRPDGIRTDALRTQGIRSAR
ncbi:IucA/IucC family siderophore biosynthesis protein [Streptomyces sp. FIT100]|uniref:IucA/IucC family protein n=1 Tax=Streptomyces sp. FIT100 TaxID=2837956 RepID=UPI0021C6EDC0|nr:IucA/IucC family protein [Streptomyces sp. FIT100]UUN25125.1 iron transporter [Streptomyces sp. FIT100]